MNFVETAVQSNLRDPSGLGPEGVLILEFAEFARRLDCIIVRGHDTLDNLGSLSQI